MEVEKIRQLVAELITLMNENELGELEIEEGDNRIRLKKSSCDAVQTTVVAAPGATTPILAAPGTAPATEAGEPELEPGVIEIPAPLIGTFYRAPSPDSPPFVDADDEITEETVVCIIEAMKVMNEIKAEVNGRIVAVLVENGEPVEFGEPLFRVKQE